MVGDDTNTYNLVQLNPHAALWLLNVRYQAYLGTPQLFNSPLSEQMHHPPCAYYWCSCESLQPSYLQLLGKNFSSSVLSLGQKKSALSPGCLHNWPHEISSHWLHLRCQNASCHNLLQLWEPWNSWVDRYVKVPWSYCLLGLQKQQFFLWRCLCCRFCPRKKLQNQKSLSFGLITNMAIPLNQLLVVFHMFTVGSCPSWPR